MTVITGFNSADTLYATEEDAVAAALQSIALYNLRNEPRRVYTFSYVSHGPNRTGILGIVCVEGQEAFSIHNCADRYVYDSVL